MRRKMVLFLVAGLGLALPGCGSTGQAPAPSAGPSAPSPPQPSRVELTGYVDDTSFRPISNAIVEVMDGPQAGASARTDATGKFSLTGQFDGSTRFRASNTGYEPGVLPFQVPGITFFLGVEGPSGDTATLTVEADPACDGLPTEVRKRSYPATVTQAFAQNNKTFSATLNAPSLDAYFHVVFIEVSGDVVTFDMSDNGIEEEVADETYLFIGGMAAARPHAAAPAVSALLSPGLIDYCIVHSDPGSQYPCTDQAITRTQCNSPNSRVTLTWQ